jgi:MFS superfamily sulfate permease-like transporter
MTRQQPLPGSIIVHPIALLAMATTWCNDRYLKHVHPGWVTGKLSDLAGLAFFPFWAIGCIELLLLLCGRRRLARTRSMLVVVVATAFLFSGIKLSPAASRYYEHFIARIRSVGLSTSVPNVQVSNAVDLTDLIALPALGLGLWVVHKRDARRRTSELQRK